MMIVEDVIGRIENPSLNVRAAALVPSRAIQK
jgi:hypothetical protein